MGRMLDALRRIDDSDASWTYQPETLGAQCNAAGLSVPAPTPRPTEAAPSAVDLSEGRPSAVRSPTESLETAARQEGPRDEERAANKALDAEAMASDTASPSPFLPLTDRRTEGGVTSVPTDSPGSSRSPKMDDGSEEGKANPWGTALRPLATVVQLPPRVATDTKPPQRAADPQVQAEPRPRQVSGGTSRWWKAPSQLGPASVAPKGSRRTPSAPADGPQSVPAAPPAKPVEPPVTTLACGDVASHLLREFPPGRTTTLLFCSPDADDTMASAVAALAAAMDSQATGQILVVDGGRGGIGREPLLAAAPRREEEPRIESATTAAGKSGWQKAIWSTRLKHVDVLPATAAEKGMGLPGRKDAENWAAALRQLRREYQLVLVGTAAADSPAAQAAARCTDAAYLIVQPGQTGRRASRRAVRMLQQAGGRVLGCLLVEPSVGK